MNLLMFLIVFSYKLYVPAHIDRGFKALPYSTYINTLKDTTKPVFDPCTIKMDTLIIHRTEVKKTIINEYRSFVYTYEPDSIKPIEKVREIEADSFIIISSTDPTGSERHNKDLALKRAEYLKSFLKGIVRTETKPGMGRFTIVKVKVLKRR